MPVYNEAESVRELVAHLGAVAPEAQVIIVDASTDAASQAVIADLQSRCPAHGRTLIVQAPRPGRAVQMNCGAARAGGGMLLFLHCDTRLRPGSVAQARAALDRGFVWGRFDVALDAGGAIYRVIETMINLRSRLRRLATGDQGIFVTAAAFKAAGGFPAIELMEDIEFSRRMAACGRPAVIAEPITTSARRWRNRGPCSTILLMWRLRLLHWLGVSPRRLSRMYGDER